MNRCLTEGRFGQWMLGKRVSSNTLTKLAARQFFGRKQRADFRPREMAKQIPIDTFSCASVSLGNCRELSVLAETQHLFE
jgi:hypothetical protein